MSLTARRRSFRRLIKVAIVGAGPAGIAAARVLAAHGVAAGADRRRPPGRAARSIASRGRDCALDIAALLGAEAENYRAHPCGVRRACETASTIGRRRSPGVSRTGRSIRSSGNVAATVDFDALILATGATDRTLPIAGWTLPGVFTLGGAQVLLKEHGCLIGRRIVFCGSSPLLYLAAKQYRAMGAEIVAVLDTTPFAAKMSAAQRICWRRPARSRAVSATWRRCAAPASRCITASRFARSKAQAASKPCAFGTATGTRSRWPAMRSRSGSASSPETQLAELAGCRFRYDPVFRQWLPRADADGRCGSSIYRGGRWRDRRRRAGRGAHRRRLRPARCWRISRSQSPASTGRALAAPGRAPAPLSARPCARLRLAGRCDRTSSTTASWSAAARAFRPATCARDPRGIRPDRGQSPESHHPLRHGPLPGALLRARRRRADRADAQRAARSRRPPARAAAGQAAAARGQSCGKCCGRSAR